MNTPNKLTLLRVVMIPVFLLVLYLGFPYCSYVAAGIFMLASLTDLADGYIARRRNQITDFGKFMDPLADKVLVFAAMLWFLRMGLFPVWAVLVVLARELAVTALRLVAVDNGRVIAAAKSGKVNTASTMVCLILMFFSLPAWANWVGVAIITVTTVLSGVEYFLRNKDALVWTK